MELSIRGLTKHFCIKGQEKKVSVFEDFDFSVPAGSFVSIVGPSGCGKSSLLKIMAGLDNDYRGKIFWNGTDLKGHAQQVGMVFQEYALFPWRTTLKNIEAGLEFVGVPKPFRRVEATKYINEFGLNGFEHCLPKELSGGMRQRVAIARTLIMKPKLLLMDEPFAALDSQTRNSMHKFLLERLQDRKATVVFVTHNVDEAVFLSDRILVLSPRPAKIISVIEVPMPHPRDRTSGEVNSIRRAILKTLEESISG